MPKILIIEDDNDINSMLSDLFEGNGYETVSAFSGTEALLHAGSHKFDIILLDIMLPGKSGDAVLSEIRGNKDNTPIIAVSAKDDKETKISMLRNGADDYVTKPFDTDELLARAEALLRRNSNDLEWNHEAAEDIIFKDIRLNRTSFTVDVSGKQVAFTKREFMILDLLMSNPKKVFTKNNIFESVYNEEFFGEDNTVNVHISNIRSKLEKANPKEKYIQTVWGIGFKMQADE